jgi:hypothetical protein
MSWTLYVVFLAMTSLSLFLYQWLSVTVSQHRPLGIWTELDIVGTSSRSRLSFAGAICRSILSTRTLASEGYRKFNEELHKPFALPTTWVQGGTVLVLPPTLVPLLTRPDKTREGEWTSLRGMVETIQLPYIMGDSSIYQNVLQFSVVRRKMQDRDMGRLAPITAVEVDKAFSDVCGVETS